MNVLNSGRAARVLLACLAVWFAGAGCRRSSPDVTAELTPILQSERGSSKRDKVVWTDVRNVYGVREGEPFWVTDREVARVADDALASIRRAAEHGLDPEHYGATDLGREVERLRAADRAERTAAALARLDSNLTRALLDLGRDVAVGVSDTLPPGVIVREAGRTPPDVATRLSAIVEEGDLAAWPDDVRPRHLQYAALQAALKALLAGGPVAAPGPPEPAGDRSKATPGAAAQPSDRQRIAFNMERWRHMPDDLGARHILVNIPQFHLWVREGDRVVHNQRIIVGTQGDQTPIFSADMNQVVFSPYWNLPESIVEGETLPAILRNPSYLERNNMEVLRRSGGSVERVDPSTVDWNDPSVTKELSLRQRPGPSNALGHVKFLMPNRHAVYLHDTPADQLFDKTGRAFSHGCVRLEEPIALAKYVLADQPEWTEDKIKTAMHSGDEQVVKLKQPLPVHLVYFTAWVDETGKVQVFKDVYSRDRLK
jgi:murein L,D-transpeptidase YcbB/YkuD